TAVEDGYHNFYASVLDTLDLNAAVQALKNSVPSPEAWRVRSAEFFFAMVYGHFLDVHRRPRERKETVRRLVTKLRRRARKNPNLALPPDARRRVRETLADEETDR